MKVCADYIRLDRNEYPVQETRKGAEGLEFLVFFGKNNAQWVLEADTEEVLFECDNCDESHWVESGTWALSRGLCYSCNNAYEGG